MQTQCEIQQAITLLTNARNLLDGTPKRGFAVHERQLGNIIKEVTNTLAAHNAPQRAVVQAKRYSGDVGIVKKVLDEAGMLEEFAQFYNDKSKVSGARRIKCSDASKLWDAEAQVRADVLAALKAAFGARFNSMYFIKQPGYYGTGMQLCIKLHS